MFKVHVESTELLLEDCRAGANGWLRVSVGTDPHGLSGTSGLSGSGHTNASGTGGAGGPNAGPSAIDIEPIAHVADERQDPHVLSIHAVYGVYSLLSGPYLAVITDARVIGSGPSSEKIYCVLGAALVPVSAAAQRSFTKHASKREQHDEREYIRMLQSVLASKTFYFSYDYDLTLSAQRRAGHATASAAAQKLPLWQKAEDDFFWNKPVLAKFMELELHNWIVPVISGFVKVLKKCEVDGQRCDLLFFTRRSWHRVGTRFNVRGVDKDGCVANFAETEMLLVKPDRSICSYVQIRGSIPLYWDQVVTLKYMPRTRYAFSGNESIVDWNELAFRAHMDSIIQRYGHITVVNLIDKAGKTKTVRDQAQLGSAFGKYVKKYNQQSHQAASEYPPTTTSTTLNGFTSGSNSPSKGRSASVSNGSNAFPIPALAATAVTGTAHSFHGSPSSASSIAGSGSSSAGSKAPTTTTKSSLFAEPIVYVWFDFHHECRKMQWGNLSKLMTDVQDQFQQYGWFECDGEGRLLSRQKGVFRVNCMDNLDRTNVVMSLFARRASLMALGLFHEKAAAQNVLDSPYAAFELVFKHTWADNADYVSKMYAGTGALKTDFTRTGKRTLAGALQDGVNSVTRYYLNNFADGVRQDAYDLLVGNYTPDRRDESPFSFQHQHTLLNMVLEMCIASVLIVGASVSWRVQEDLATRIRDGVMASIAVFGVLGYFMLKKGAFRSLGRRYVSKPAFSSSGYIRKKEL